MNVFKLSLKSFFKTKYIFITFISSFVILNAYSIMFIATNFVSTEAFFFLQFLNFTAYYMAVITFLSYEYFYKTKRLNIDECLSSTVNGKRKLFYNQFFVILILNLFLSINILILTIYSSISSDVTEKAYLLHLFYNVILNFFLPGLFSVLLGAVAALKLSRLTAYLFLSAFIFLGSPMMMDISLRLGIYRFIEFFSLSNLSAKSIPDFFMGFSLLIHRWGLVFFWISLCAAAIFIILYKNKPVFRITAAICCLLACGLSLREFVMPISKSDKNHYYTEIESLYYSDNPQKKQAGGFNISSYNMNLRIDRLLEASVEMEVDVNNLQQYIFTLYHGYHITQVSDDSGNPLTYKQEGDYITIDNNSSGSLKSIVFKYYGYNYKFYSNSEAVLLPGSFPYYPFSGFHEIFNISNRVFDIRNDGIKCGFEITIDFDSKLNIYSNLDKVDGNTFSGVAESVLLFAGRFLTQTEVGGITAVYSYLDNSYSMQEVEDALRRLKESKHLNENLRYVFFTPTVFSSDFYPVYNDYMECDSAPVLVYGYEKALILPHKKWLYIVIYEFYIPARYKYERFTENEKMESYTEEKIITVINKLFEKYGETETLAEIDKFVFDNNDERKSIDFLNDFLEGGTANAGN